MSLKEFCRSLQQCAEKLEEEVKCNINDVHNIFFCKAMDETRLALERAKDYHYKEIVEALNVILKNVKILLFHQDKIEWLSNDANFTSDDLKRFSYVKRQVYAFSQNEQKPALSRSVENISMHYNSKKERRRTVSEISAQTLESWEKYLDQKEQNETKIMEDTIQTKQAVSRRTGSGGRARKKFVSSTMGGFLDDNERPRISLESIIEKPQNDEDSDNSNSDNIYTEKHENQDVSVIESTKDKPEDADLYKTHNQVAEYHHYPLSYSVTNSNEEDGPTTHAIIPTFLAHTTSTMNAVEGKVAYSNSINTNVKISTALDLVNRINESKIGREDILSEVISEMEDNVEKEMCSLPEEPIKVKPKIVDVIYKKKHYQ